MTNEAPDDIPFCWDPVLTDEIPFCWDPDETPDEIPFCYLTMLPPEEIGTFTLVQGFTEGKTSV